MTERYSDQKKDRILQNPLFDKIQNYLEEASGTRKIVYVIAPYVKASVLERLLENVDARIVVITSWKAEDLAHGASDVETYQVCERFGARLYVNNTIHLKVYSIDFDDAILSTANVSRRGLGVDTDNPSVECATLIHDLSENDRLYLASIQKNAILVDDDMYSWAKIWISKQEIVPAVVGKHEIADMMYKKKSFLISALRSFSDRSCISVAHSTLGLSVSTPRPRRDTLAVDNMASSKSIEYTLRCIVLFTYSLAPNLSHT